MNRQYSQLYLLIQDTTSQSKHTIEIGISILVGFDTLKDSREALQPLQVIDTSPGHGVPSVVMTETNAEAEDVVADADVNEKKASKRDTFVNLSGNKYAVLYYNDDTD